MRDPLRFPATNARIAACLLFGASLALAACGRSSPPDRGDARSASPSQQPASSADPRARFVDMSWRVESSNAVAPGTRYRFGSDGTLRIDAPGSTPALGRWTWAHGALVMIEDGIAYPTDILHLDARRFSIRSHNPGTPVDIAMVRVGAAAPPGPSP
jgi:hypothetical protein